jgi:hypothetical protein
VFITMVRSSGIIVFLLVVLLLGTLASIKAQSEPLLESVSIDESTGPFNPHQPQDEPAARRSGA